MEDSSLSELHEDFIILPSQEESQIVEMKDALKNLPALQGKDLTLEDDDQSTDGPPSRNKQDDNSFPVEQGNIPFSSDELLASTGKDELSLGKSPDQYEAYKTQEGQVQGSRLQLFRASQEDVFAAERDHEEGRISTPAEHIGSLQLSQIPMLVPETEEDSNIIPPSPEAFGQTPMIIPGSPTQDEEEHEDNRSTSSYKTNGDEEEYDITIMNTYTDNPKKLRTETLVSMTDDEKTKDYVLDEITETNIDTASYVQTRQYTSQEFQAALEVPTLVDDDNSESLHLYLTESTQASRNSLRKSIEIDLTSSDVGITPGGRDDKQLDDEVILIRTGADSNGEVDDSQNFSLHLTPSQGHSLHSQRSQMSQGLQSQGGIFKGEGETKKFCKKTSGRKSNTAQSQSIVEETFQSQKSQGEKRASQRSVEKSQSQGSKGSGSQGQNSQGSRKHEGKIRSRRQSKEDKLIADVNANPIVMWKDESDSERKRIEMKSAKSSSSEQIMGFHLSVPKDTPSEPPDPKVSEYVTPTPKAQKTSNTRLSQQDQGVAEQKKDDSFIEVDDDVSLRRALTITMIQTDTEASTQPEFKLDRPVVESEPAEIDEETEDMFARKKVSKPKVIEDDSDEEEEKTSLTAHHGSSEEILYARKVDDHNPENFELETDTTETYDPESQMDVNVNIDKERGDEKAVQSGDYLVKEKTFETNDDRMRDKATELKEMSTQTINKGPGSIEVDESVVEKVAQYLQTGISPRSRASSVCTDWSGSHPGEEAEKGDISKTPKLQKSLGNDTKGETPSRRRASENTEKKSPEEIKTIIQTYSSILSKSKQRRKSGEHHLPSSQRPNPGCETPGKSKSLQPRRLSTQSSPAELGKSQIIEREDSWMMPRKTDLNVSTNVELENTGNFVPNDLDYIKTHKLKVLKDLAKTFATEDSIAENVQVEDSNEGKTMSVSFSKQTTVTDKSMNLEIDNETAACSTNKSTIINDKSYISCSTNTVASEQPEKAVEADRSKRSLIETTSSQKEIKLKGFSDSSLRRENFDFLTKSPIVKLTNISHLHESPSPVIIRKVTPSSKFSRSSLKQTKTRQKRFKSISERNSQKRNSSASTSPNSSGLFTASTQRFQLKKNSPGQDPYKFHGTQSQVSPQERTPRVESSTRKRKLLHRKSGLKKRPSSNVHVSFKSTESPSAIEPAQTVSQQSNVTTTTSSGSIPSIPSTISQKSPSLEPTISSSSSSSRQTAREIATRLSGKRLSVDTGLPDTIPLHHSEEDNYKRVTIVTETVEKLYREITTTRKVVDIDGNVLESSVDINKMDPVVVEENTHKRVQYIYIPSPSRSAASLTSGDLGDVSSSLSKSSLSSGSFGSKVSITTSASVERVEQNQGSSVNKPNGSNSSNREGSENTVLTQKSPQTTIQSKPCTPQEGNQSKSSILKKGNQSLSVSPAIPSTSAAAASDQDASGYFTPLGSTIDKTGSHLHERTSSVDSPKASESLFSSSDEKKRNTGATKTVEEKKDYVEMASKKEKCKGQSTPHQVQSVSSSSSSQGDGSMIPSSGTIGSRVIAKWRDGFYYPGILKSAPDRYSRCSVKFDDGDSKLVKMTDILLIERLPAGQSVLVLRDDGAFESGLILQQFADCYRVETDDGETESYTFGQVILSPDQASFLISDRGHEILIQAPVQNPTSSNAGDVSLDNLVDTPRRAHGKEIVSSKVKEEKVPEPVPSTRSRKRKFDVMKPQATSTPTPKGKQDGTLKRRRVEESNDTSPIRTADEASPSPRKSPRKTKVGLFQKETGPLPTKKIFRGITFLMTNVVKSKDQLDQERRLLQPSSLDTSSDESAVEDDVSTPFDRVHLKAQIEAGGGSVLGNFDIKVIEGKKRCVLLSSTYQRTIKYLQCLAAGLPCISHMWIVNSCVQNELLDEKLYILPAGISLEKRKVIEWKTKNDVFIGMKAIVHSKDNEFVEKWTNILRLSKCQIQKQLQYTDIDVIVTDGSCFSSVERQASKNNVPIVSTEWVIQSLINRKVASFTGHPRYRHDLVSA